MIIQFYAIIIIIINFVWNVCAERPWLIDNLNEWLVRMTGPAYSKVALFVDNSGADIVLGVIPFVRELLRQNTKVR